MKKNIKTSKVLTVFQIINTAKYTKLEDTDKIKVWKMCRVLKPIATKFEEDSKDAAEKFKADIKDFDERLKKAQEYETIKQKAEGNTPITDKEYNEFINEFKKYQTLVGKATEEFANKEIEIEFEPLSEDAFGKLMASNEWNIEQTMIVGDLVCE